MCDGVKTGQRENLNCIAVAKRCQPIPWGAESGPALVGGGMSQIKAKRLGPLDWSLNLGCLGRGEDVTLGEAVSFCYR